jgi:hypothetical protein
MDPHTPKHEAIDKFIHHESSAIGKWRIKVLEEAHDPIVRLQAFRDDVVESAPEKSLEVHTRQVRLADDELDESTKTLIRRWLASL